MRVTPTRPMPVPTDNALALTGSRATTGDAEPRAIRDETYPRSSRLLRRGEFVRVQQGGKRVHTAHFIVLMMPGVGQRLGVTVGRRVGGSVQRNRIKRVVREVFRRNRELFPVDCAIVLVARTGADRLDYESVKSELVKAQSALSRVRQQWIALAAATAQTPPSAP
jgi:ribonuclease P protein component